MSRPTVLLGGGVDEGYGRVADAFRANLSSGQEVGAAFSVYRDGRKVVDLWGGYRDGVTGAPWTQDTVVNMFSSTKGVASLAVALAVSRGLLDYEAKVADYWPEFAQAGKAEVSVRQLLAHQAGLAAIHPALTLRDLADLPRLADKLAAQKPNWPPGERHGYHGITLGWYEGELIRRVDPAGRSLGRFFAEEIAAPMGLDFYIGLPDSVDRDRVALLDTWPFTRLLLNLDKFPPKMVAALFNPRSLSFRALRSVKGVSNLSKFNNDEVRKVEMPAANGTGTARSVAQLYGDAATGGAQLGLTPEVFGELKRAPTPPTGGVRDMVLHTDSAFALGFLKSTPFSVFGSSDDAFGTPGAGGSFGFADPDTGVGYSYVMNKLGVHLISDPRELALRQTLFRDVLGARPQS
ncbi:serine hydrolase domain-containing protein [Mycolicibacterium brumae]|uniref:EstA family serine hydrolase n=1 Tax=Mycolicibacterium brumae TaxID=85968 RepID=A0A2G5PBL1_9MYCO|nr:serine hydrolase domain-containing protein [Mycolicibacterium brumae]MCV7191460.1 beta-lactamase family protein [Mycolicibacterium brumae]PIB75731.1 EstA family serine hydrolase [Mycolicibacterium brumae]UWW09432.1 beta-lactamase family protein [Mycolicibacterium brumae]